MHVPPHALAISVYSMPTEDSLLSLDDLDRIATRLRHCLAAAAAIEAGALRERIEADAAVRELVVVRLDRLLLR